jgi:transposase
MEVNSMNEALKIQLKILRLSKVKPNFSELARQYNLDRRTVKKYYDGYEGKPTHRNKRSKLDQYQKLIEQKLQIKGTNVKSVYEFIITEVDSNIGTYSNFNKYVISKGLKPKKTPKGHPRFETAPGIQAQVDWKENISIANKYGEIFTFQVFDYKLGNSRYTHFTYKLYKTRQDVFDCLIASFQATGGVPREILFDNMSSVVDRDGNRANISNQMRSFAKDFNFKIKLCKPRHPFTKGKVETVNKFLAWILPYEGEFETEEDLIEILIKINQKVNAYICQEIGVPPLLLFQKEKEYLQPLPKNDVIESYLSHDRQTTVRLDSMVTYMNSKYSVPADYIGKPVRLLVVNHNLQIYYSTNLIATHVLSEKRLNYKKDHYQQLLSQRMKDADTVAELAQANLKQMDQFL